MVIDTEAHKWKMCREMRYLRALNLNGESLANLSSQGLVVYVEEEAKTL